MSPLLLEMRYANMKSNNQSYDPIERANNLALIQASADFATDLINSRKLYYMNISTNFRKLIINLKQTYQQINKLNNDEIMIANDETNSKMMKMIRLKLQQLTHSITTTTYTTKINEIPFDTNKTIISKKKQFIFETIEANDNENASTSGATYQQNEINVELKLEIDMHKRNIIKNIINAIITSSKSVQQLNNAAHLNARQMLKKIHRAKTIAMEMKYNNTLTYEQSQSVTNDFNICIRFAHQIENNISTLIENIGKIIAYLKLNETKLLLLEKNDEFQYLINLENKLSDNLIDFDDIIDAGEKASDLIESVELESLFYLPTQESIRYEKMFYNHLSEFVSLTQNFGTAWNANDALADMLQCLLIYIMNDDNDDDDDDNNEFRVF
ncbi:unnamed protein product [Wuchereria bancrofti]|uniref:Uncharacterized protein n=1 Tax=Wuchereria bancrofti TaxID=6293 RepID=A0A3P7FRK5_WUCBA|nr:unnamed protein product [Wuchereria bancrofti]